MFARMQGAVHHSQELLKLAIGSFDLFRASSTEAVLKINSLFRAGREDVDEPSSVSGDSERQGGACPPT